MSLHLYVATVKNLRGVLYSTEDYNSLETFVKWLNKRFKYRTLGVTKSFLETFPQIREKLGKVFVELFYPNEELEEIVSRVSKILGKETEFIAFASMYVSPLLILGDYSSLEKWCIGRILTTKSLDDRSWKLHMRIADYSILDMYQWSTTNSLKILEALAKGDNANVETLLNERKKMIEKDKKRYWRISEKEGDPIILYLDMLPAIIGKTELRQFILSHLSTAPAILAVVTAIIIQRD